MSKMVGFQERRKQKRFNVKRGVLAALVPSFDKLGQIKNISKGGLAFQYMGNAETAKDSCELEILSIVDSFYLRELSVKIVLDCEVDTQVPFSSLQTRQVSIQFEELKDHQKDLLSHFLEKYTYN